MSKASRHGGATDPATVVRNLPGIAYWKNASGEYLGCSQAFLALVGLKNEADVVGKTDFDLCWQKQAPQLRAHDHKVMKSKQAHSLKEQVVVDDGSKRTYAVEKKPFYNAKGEVIGIIGISIDITASEDEEKRLEDEVQKRLKDEVYLLRQLADKLPVPFYWLDLDQYYLGINEQALKASGTRSYQHHFSGRTPLDLYPEHMAQEIIDHHREVIEQQKILSFEESIHDVTTKAYKVFNATIAPLYSSAGEIIGTHGVSIDITQEKAYEKQLLELTEKLKGEVHLLKQFADMIPQPFYWLDLNQYYLGVNKCNIEVTGTSSYEVDFLGNTPFDLYPEEMANAIVTHHQEVIRKREILCFEESILDVATKEYKLFSATIAPLFDSDGELIGTCGISVDITKEKQLQYDLLKAKKRADAASQAKSTFIANMSHDIRTPITGILAMAERIRYSAAEAMSLDHEDLQETLDQLATDAQEDSTMLMAATHELLNLCNEILEVVKLESGQTTGKVEAFSLQKMLEEAVGLLKPAFVEKGLEFTYDIGAMVPVHLQGERLYLNRVLLNLLSNALKFTQEGFVRVKVERIDDAPCDPGSTVVLKLTVADSGIGIPADKKGLIFENFSRLTSSYDGVYKGSGMGLYTVQQYTKSLQGTIRVDSVEGEGSVFTVEVPMLVASEEAVAQGEQERLKKAKRNTLETPSPAVVRRRGSRVKSEPDGPRVLVVEDSKLAFVALEMLLRPYQCRVDHAATAQEGVDMAGAEPYELVLMDVGLPDFSGIEATRLIREQKDAEALPIVAVTGHADDPEQCQACFEAGMQRVLSKPASAAELAEVFDTYFASKPMPDKDVINWMGCLQCCQGDEELLRYMLSLIENDWQQAQELLGQYGEKSQHLELRAALHRLRGNVTYLKLPELARSLQAFHQAVQAGEVEAMTKGYEALQRAWQRFEKGCRLLPK